MDIGKQSILVTDDNPENLKVLREILTKEGYNVRVAMSGEQALESINLSPPDLLLLDIQLPKMDGYEVCRQIKQDSNNQTIPIIFVSAMSEAFNKLLAFQAGGDDYIPKPFQMEEVLARIKTHLKAAQYEKYLKDRADISEQKYQAIVEDTPVLICRYLPDGEIVFVNSEYCRFFGKTLSDFVGTTFFDILPDGEKHVFCSCLEHLTPESPTIKYEHQFLLEKGQTRWLRWINRGLYHPKKGLAVFQAIGEDITEQKLAEHSLLRTKALLSEAETLGNVGGWEYNISSEKTYWTDNMHRLFGYEPGDLEDSHSFFMNQILHPDDQEAVSEKLKQIIKTQTLGEMDFRILNKSGQERIFHGIVNPVIDSYGMTKRVYGSNMDITDQLNAEKEKKQIQSQLQQAQKLEALGTLAGGIAHDFNNILTAILGYAKLIETDLSEEEKMFGDVSEIIIAANRARDLVNQILTFSRMKEIQLKPIRIDIIIKEVIRLIRSTIPTTIKIINNVERLHDHVLADPTQIHQIIMNLCTNASHAMEKEGGTLTVALRKVSHFPQTELDHQNQIDKPFLELTVNDTGCGIPEENLSIIFDPYFTTKQLGEGTGLGLSVVQGIIKNCGGEIRVSSISGEGSEFKVYLPVVQQKAKSKIKKDQGIQGGDETILLVDDEPSILDVAQRLLMKLGYKIVAEKDSVRALEILRDEPGKFDLLITDTAMPRMDGITLAQKAMELYPQLPVMICTGYNHMVTKEKCQKLGIKALCYKPLSIPVITEKIRNILDNHNTI